MAKKNYEKYQAEIHALREFVSAKGWSIADEREIDYGYQIRVFDGVTKNSVDFFPSGKKLIQGKPGALRTELLLWSEELAKSPALFTDIPLGLTEAPQQQSPTTTEAKNKGTIAMEPIYTARIGLGVAGKENYFGPLAVSAVHVDAWAEAQFAMLGIHNGDLSSVEDTLAIAEEIKAICPYNVVTIGNKRYNEAYEKVHSQDSLWAWANARAIENILGKVSCSIVVAEQFGDEAILQNALSKKGHLIKLEQRVSSRRDSTVMAASILAHAALMQHMQQLSQQLNKDLPIGASDPAIITIGQEIVAKGGQNALANVAKLHFRTTQMILQK